MGASAAAFTVTTAISLIITQWLASGFGGYLTGRLRTSWTGLPTHEVLFRDTANGLLSWAVAAVIAGGFLAVAVTSAIHTAATLNSAPDYRVDSLYRTDHPSAVLSDQDVRAQTLRILTHDGVDGVISDADKQYLTQLVAARTGLSRQDAGARVDMAAADQAAAGVKLHQAAESARKAAAYLSIFTALAMLVGAFIASVAAALGGRQRDAALNSAR